MLLSLFAANDSCVSLPVVVASEVSMLWWDMTVHIVVTTVLDVAYSACLSMGVGHIGEPCNAKKMAKLIKMLFGDTHMWGPS